MQRKDLPEKKCFASPGIAVAVLAGGESRRFGSQKALARFGSRTLLERAVDIGKAISPDVFLILSYVDQLPIELHNISIKIDCIPNCGPLGGIFTAVSACNAQFLAVLPCDLPLLSPGIYKFLMKFCSQDRVIVAKSHRGIEPLVSIWPRFAEIQLGTELQRGRFSPLDLFKRVNTCFIDLPREIPNYREHWFLNINTPSDLEELCKVSTVDLQT